MTDETQVVSEQTLRPEIDALKKEIARADGALITLSKTTKDGEGLLIAAKYLKGPTERQQGNLRILKNNLETGADPNFYIWENTSPLVTGVLLVDVYAQDETEEEGMQIITPIGHMDWFLEDDYANGGGNMHGAQIAQNAHERRAGMQWKNQSAAFRVKDEYQQQGLGALLLAVSGVALESIGVRRFYSGVLTPNSEKVYERFGIKYSDFPSRRTDWATAGDNVHLPIERLSQSLHINKVLSSFV